MTQPRKDTTAGLWSNIEWQDTIQRDINRKRHSPGGYNIEGHNLEWLLTSHIKSKHTNDKKEFLCEECSSKYASKKSLKEHIKLKHENEKQEFECPKCGKKFALKKTFNRHLLIHDQENDLNVITDWRYVGFVKLIYN